MWNLNLADRHNPSNQSVQKWAGVDYGITHLPSSEGEASVLSESMMKPNPFWLLKNFTRPVLRVGKVDITGM